MSSVLSIAASGLAAQSKSLAISADNVANVRSLGLRADGGNAGGGAFVPMRTAFSSIAGGGVRATGVPIAPPSQMAYEPDDPDADSEGMVPRPNVSLEREIVAQITALRVYQALMKAIDTESKMLGSLFDATS